MILMDIIKSGLDTHITRMSQIKLILALLVTSITLTVALNPLAGGTFLGVTVSPLDWSKGVAIFDLSANGTCLSPDGKWIVPCGITVTPILVTNLEMDSYSYTRSVDYTRDATSHVSIDVSAGYGSFSAKGSFSQDTRNYLHYSYGSSSTMVESDAEMQLYLLQTQLMTAPLNTEFRTYVSTVAAAIQSQDTAKYNYWMNQFITTVPYLVVTSVTTGGRLAETNYVSNSYYSDTAITTVQGSASASASFSGLFSVDGQYNWGVSTQQIQQFQESETSSSTSAVGGPYVAGMNMTDYQNQVMDNPGIISYTLGKTSFWLQPEFFPNISVDILTKIRSDYELVWAEYIANNSLPGCTDMYASNFNLTATVDDNSCVRQYINGSSFGGIYSLSQHIIQAPNMPTQVTTIFSNPNPLTGGLSCPAGTGPTCMNLVSSWSFPWVGGKITGTTTATYCVCMGPDGSSNQPAFGGIYSTSSPNPLTNLASCPPGMTGRSVGLITACIGSNASESYRFGGMYAYIDGACQTNPYTSTCGCPNFAPLAFPYSDQVQVYPSNPPTTGQMYICIGQPEYIINPTPGPLPNLVSLVVPYLSTNVTPPTPNPSNPPKGGSFLTIGLILGGIGIGVGLLLAGIITILIIRRAKNRSSYASIDA